MKTEMWRKKENVTNAVNEQGVNVWVRASFAKRNGKEKVCPICNSNQVQRLIRIQNRLFEEKEGEREGGVKSLKKDENTSQVDAKQKKGS